MKEILKAEHVYKIYGVNGKHPFQALSDISLTINEGEFICVMGPSGAGKSTFVNNMSTIDKPTKGVVTINGKKVMDMNDEEICKFRYENIGFIFQEFNLLDSLTMYENIAIPLSLLGKDPTYIDEKVRTIAKELEVEIILNKYPGECSGGQQQRVAIARALVSSPQIIVADEPTGNLDSKNSHEILELFKKINDQGTTILMVTHDARIGSYSSKLIYISDGVIDKVIERGEDTQQDYFYKIVEITSSEAQALLED